MHGVKFGGQTISLQFAKVSTSSPRLVQCSDSADAHRVILHLDLCRTHHRPTGDLTVHHHHPNQQAVDDHAHLPLAAELHETTTTEATHEVVQHLHAMTETATALDEEDEVTEATTDEAAVAAAEVEHQEAATTTEEKLPERTTAVAAMEKLKLRKVRMHLRRRLTTTVLPVLTATKAIPKLILEAERMISLLPLPSIPKQTTTKRRGNQSMSPSCQTSLHDLDERLLSSCLAPSGAILRF